MFRAIVRNVFVLVLAEALVLTMAFCMSVRGKALLAKLFRTKRPANDNNMTTETTIDV